MIIFSIYIQVKTRPATREVLATYCLGEVTIEMVINLPPNYPLGSISVKSEKRVGVSAQQWEKWLLQLNIFLQHQVRHSQVTIEMVITLPPNYPVGSISVKSERRVGVSAQQ